ncbi:MAG: DUF998 domain-containing protein [Methanomassiliicoccales archaeon]
MRDEHAAGILLTVGGIQFLIMMLVAETIYPSYSVSKNYISDLGVGRTALLFNISIILLGLLIILSGYLLRSFYLPLFPVFFLAGLGAALVGIFPENTGEIHSLSALLVFAMGGIATYFILARVRSVLSLIWAVLGTIGLAALALFAAGHYLGLGPGGMERMIAIPELLMLISFGAYLDSH